MKIIKKYKLILLLLVCLIIIILLIYLKDKKIDLFKVTIKSFEFLDNISNSKNSLENKQLGDLSILNTNIDNLTKDTQIVINGGILPTKQIVINGGILPTTQPIIPQFINAVDQEEVTGLLKSNNSTIPNLLNPTITTIPNLLNPTITTIPNLLNPTITTIPTLYPFIVPFVQPNFVPITLAEARTACENGFNDYAFSNISEKCKYYSSSNTDTNFNINLEQCAYDLYNNGSIQSYIIKENADVLSSYCCDTNPILCKTDPITTTPILM